MRPQLKKKHLKKNDQPGEIVDFPVPVKRGNSNNGKVSGKSSRFNNVGWDTSHQRWYAVAEHPVSGKRTKSTKFKTQKEAYQWQQQKLSEFQSELDGLSELNGSIKLICQEGIQLLESKGILSLENLRACFQEYIENHPEANPTTVEQWFDFWIEEKKRTTSSEHSWRTAMSVLRPIVEEFGKLPLPKITQEMCKPYLTDSRVKLITQNKRKRYLNNFFKEAQLCGKMNAQETSHPTKNIKLPKQIEEYDDDKPWSLKDFETLLRFSLINEDRYRTTAYILIGAYTGMRTEEILKIKFAHDEINIDSGDVWVSSRIAKTRKARHFVMKPELR